MRREGERRKAAFVDVEFLPELPGPASLRRRGIPTIALRPPCDAAVEKDRRDDENNRLSRPAARRGTRRRARPANAGRSASRLSQVRGAAAEIDARSALSRQVRHKRALPVNCRSPCDRTEGGFSTTSPHNRALTVTELGHPERSVCVAPAKATDLCGRPGTASTELAVSRFEQAGRPAPSAVSPPVRYDDHRRKIRNERAASPRSQRPPSGPSRRHRRRQPRLRPL